jgi:hypothetical protein
MATASERVTLLDSRLELSPGVFMAKVLPANASSEVAFTLHAFARTGLAAHARIDSTGRPRTFLR